MKQAISADHGAELGTILVDAVGGADQQLSVPFTDEANGSAAASDDMHQPSHFP